MMSTDESRIEIVGKGDRVRRKETTLIEMWHFFGRHKSVLHIVASQENGNSSANNVHEPNIGKISSTIQTITLCQ